MENQTKQQATIFYDAPRPVNIGDVFYTIERGASCDFYEPCKVCGDTRKVTVNDVTFKCPVCNTGKRTLNVGKYFVRRYRVYKIADVVLTDDWKPSTRHNPYIKLYRKVGHGNNPYGGGGVIKLRLSEFVRELNRPYDAGEAIYSQDRIYDNYALALSVAEQINAAELAKVDEYNTQHGTLYVANFDLYKTTHDPKSN